MLLLGGDHHQTTPRVSFAWRRAYVATVCHCGSTYQLIVCNGFSTTPIAGCRHTSIRLVRIRRSFHRTHTRNYYYIAH